jgi:hypothetical protein
MQFHFRPASGVASAAVLTAVLCQCVLAQDAPGTKGLPPRATPADYQAQARAGAVTIAAEFAGHGIPTPDAAFSTEDYVVVEVGLFGSPGEHLALTPGDFSLRINGKKAPSPAQPYALVFKSLKDPNYVAPESAASKSSKGSIGTGGGGQNDAGNLPPIIHIPIDVERAMEQRVQKASLPEGDRPLPAAGLLFFEHRGKITSAELLYNGPAGKATLNLQP